MPTIVSSYVQTLAGSVDARAIDTLTFPFAARPQAMSIYVKFQERGLILMADDSRLWAITTTTLTGATIRVDVSANKYRIRYGNNISAAVQSAMGTAPAVGQIVELLGTLSAAGSVQLSQSIAGAAVTSGTASAGSLLPAAWSGTTLHLNSVSGANGGAIALMNLLIVRGVQDMTAMRRLAATKAA